MLRSLKTAATGMEAQQQLIDSLSNNIANVNTTAYKASRPHFHDLLYQNMRAPGLKSTTGTVVPSGIQVGNGTKLVGMDKSYKEGSVKVTGHAFDLMIKGSGFFRIQLDDGTVGYTRDGAFKRSPEGRLVTAEGLPLVPDIVVPPNSTNVKVGLDGTVTAKIAGEQGSREIGQIEIANFINPAGLSSIGRNLVVETPASGEPIVVPPGQEGTGEIGQGELESSNVNIVDEMVQMIVGQRAYELNSKVIKTGDEMLAATNQMR